MAEKTQTTEKPFTPLAEEYEKVDEKFTNSEKVKQVISWYGEQKKWYLEQTNDPERVGFWSINRIDTLVLGAEIPGLMRESGLYFILGSELADRYSATINAEPQLLLEIVRKIGKEKITQAAQDDDTDSSVALAVLEQLGLSVFDGLTIYNLKRLCKVVLKQRDILLRILYHYQVLVEAAQTVQTCAPSLQPEIDDVQANCLLVTTKFESNAALTVNGKSLIAIEGEHEDKNSLLANRDHVMRIIVNGHEFMHAITFKLLGISFDATNNPVDFDNAEHDLLSGAIAEGISIAYEAEIADHIQPDQQASYKTFIRERVKLTQEASKEFGKKKWDKGVELDNDEVGAFQYALGVRLAFILRNNGWRLNDLKVLIPKIKDIIFETAKIPPVTEQVTTELDPRWEKLAEVEEYGQREFINTVLTKIAELKPEASAA